MSAGRRGALWLLSCVLAALLGFVVGRAGAPVSGPGLLAARFVPVDGSPVVVDVDGQKLTAEQFRLRWQRLLTPDARRFHQQRGGPAHYLDEVVEELLLAEEAVRVGVAEDPELREALRRDLNRTLSRPLLEREVREQAISDRELRARFALRREEFSQPTRVRVREIVATGVPGPSGLAGSDDATTREGAREKLAGLRERVLAGESFEELASRHSEAPSARYGGLIGWVVAGRFAADYEAAALALQPGQVSEVLERGEDAFAILRVEEREEGREASFEEMRGRLLQDLLDEDPGALSRRYRVYVEGLKPRHRLELRPERLPELDGGAGAPAPR